MKKIELILLTIIILGAFLVRLYKIENPIADWHSWRQADTASVSRNFVKSGIDLLHPRFDDLSNIASGKDNPAGYRFVEFPIYNSAVAVAFQSFGRFSIEVWGRLITIIASLSSLVFLYLLVRKYCGGRVGLFAAFFFGFLPYNIYYSRAILPDPSMVMAILGATYFFDRWLERSQLRITNYAFILSIAFTAIAFLLKPFALFFTLPLIYLSYRKWGLGFVRKPQLWLFTFLTILPLILWRNWIVLFPEGIPVSDWLFNENGIRFKGAFFYWLFADRIGRLILGYWGVVLLGFGLIRKANQKEGLLFYSFVVSALMYMIVIAGGNVKHDYYQILIVPTLAIFLAKGADFLIDAPAEYFSRIAGWLMIFACCVAMLGFGWYHVRDYFNINREEIVAAGKLVDELTPKNAKVIAPYGGDTAYLYQTNRQGWPSITHPLDVMIEKGATHIAVVNPDSYFLDLTAEHKIIYQSNMLLLVELKK